MMKKGISRMMVENKSLEVSLIKQRDFLSDHIQSMLAIFPGNPYNDEIQFRLSELKYEQALQDFEISYQRFEKAMDNYEKGLSKDPPDEPAYNFSECLGIYRDIRKNYPKSQRADDALFFNALCLIKVDNFKEATGLLEQMVNDYPESEYFVEAKMRIAEYYFENPQSKEGAGYQKAVEAYKEILLFRENPNFIEALYRLGWTYYMMDKFKEAVTLFNYLIEEVDINLLALGEKSTNEATSALRNEAISYIAISLNESGGIEAAKKFLKLIGNKNYTVLVLQQMGKLYEKDLEYSNAVGIYQIILDHYPFNAFAPRAQMALISCLEKERKHEDAIKHKKKFFDSYSRNSEWAKKQSASGIFKEIDSIAILNLLSASEFYAFKGEKNNDNSLFLKAIQNYQQLEATYPQEFGTYEGLWNMGQIYEKKFKQYKNALNVYLKISRYDFPKYKKASAINAIAMAQKVHDLHSRFSDDTAGTKISGTEKTIISACHNFTGMFPDEPEIMMVLITEAAISFNHKQYVKALPIYQKILSKKKYSSAPEYEEALLFCAQAHSELGQYMKAEKKYTELYNHTKKSEIKELAYKGRVESAFRHAEILLKNNENERAISVFLRIIKDYQNYPMMDVVLFNVANAFEKIGNWSKASEYYLVLADRYPGSKHADGALFNAALNYEKDEKYKEAIDAYEKMLWTYPKSKYSKDAVYNISLDYEKLGNLEKMAETNERYATMFPNSADVDKLLFYSGKFFYKKGNLARAMEIFRKYIKYYGGKSREIEVRYMIAKVLLDQKKEKKAIDELNDLIKRNQELKGRGQGNDYFVAEAFYSLAQNEYRKFSDIQFKLPKRKIEAAQKSKTRLLKSTVEKYDKLVQMKSERLFEAAYKIGLCYENYALSLYKQERDPKLKGIKKGLFEKDLAINVAQLMEAAIKPYKGVIELSKNADLKKFSKEKLEFIKKAEEKLCMAYLQIGEMYLKAAASLENTPVPKEIQKYPPQYYLYLSKIYDTVDPFKKTSVDKFIIAYKEIGQLGLQSPYISRYKDSTASILFNRGEIFEKISTEMLTKPRLPRGLNEDEKEEIVFQLEDIAFELQDKSVANYEEALQIIKDEALEKKYQDKILERLRILVPDSYAPKKEVFRTTVVSDKSWLASPDSVDKWAELDFKAENWKSVLPGRAQSDLKFAFGTPRPIWLDPANRQVFLRRRVFLNGDPSSATLQISADDNYVLIINGKPITADREGSEDWNKIEKMDVTEFLRGGDNIIAAKAWVQDSVGSAFWLGMEIMLDTSAKYSSRYAAVTPPSKTGITPPPKELKATVSKPAETGKTPEIPKPAPPKADTRTALKKEYKTRGELKTAIIAREQKVLSLNKQISREQTKIRVLKFKLNFINLKIQSIENEIKEKKKKLRQKSDTK
jgi:tetratricopeptide (TPR) repeat protein